MATRTRLPHNQFKLGPSSWKFISAGTVVMLLTLLSLVFFGPFIYMIMSSLKSADQFQGNPPPILPLSPKTVEYNNKSYTVFGVTINGVSRELAYIGPKTNTDGTSDRNFSALFDPANPDLDHPIYLEARKAGTDLVTPDKTHFVPLSDFKIHPENYAAVLDTSTPLGNVLKFWQSIGNTLFIAIVGAIGATASAALVAYGFTRFRIPFGEVLFFILLGTIILPPQITLIPTYIVYTKLGWVPSVLPLIVPFFFSNAYNVFLLRQYFMTMPYEIDEAAKVDGASPWQVFTQLILPNSRSALLAVFLFHFLYAYNEFYLSLIYTQGNDAAEPISIRLQNFVQTYSSQPNALMASALLTMLIPLVIFFLAQRTFIQGVVITGVEK